MSYIRQRAGLKLKGEKIDGGERDEGGGTGGGGKRKAAADGEGGKGRKKGEGKQLPSTTKESPASSKVQKTMSAFFGKG